MFEQDMEKLVSVLAASQNCVTAEDWYAVLAYTMKEESAEELWLRFNDIDDPFHAFTALLLLERICLQAFGIQHTAAATLADDYRSHWFVFHGTHPEARGMELQELFPVLFSFLIQEAAASETEDSKRRASIARVKRRIFG